MNDYLGYHVFQVACYHGLRSHHAVLDIGCGALHHGRLLISYLQPGNYVGCGPDILEWETVLDDEFGDSFCGLRLPDFWPMLDFNVSVIGREFDYVIADSDYARSNIRDCILGAKEVMHQESLFLGTYGDEDWKDLREFTNNLGMRTMRVSNHIKHPSEHNWFLFQFREEPDMSWKDHIRRTRRGKWATGYTNGVGAITHRGQRAIDSYDGPLEFSGGGSVQKTFQAIRGVAAVLKDLPEQSDDWVPIEETVSE